MGLSVGPVPARVDAAVKAGIADLVAHAVAQGWSVRSACAVLVVDDTRVGRWMMRREAGEPLADAPPGGHPLHGLLDWERAAIITLFERWGDVDRSARSLAHRGSRIGAVHVSSSTLQRVLRAENLVLPGHPPRESLPRKPWPPWLEAKPNRAWGYDFTCFTGAGQGAVAILDIVSRKWITTVCSTSEPPTQVEVAFTQALRAEGLCSSPAGTTDAHRDGVNTETGLPLLFAISGSGLRLRPQSARELLASSAPCQIGRPREPQIHELIGSLFDHVKAEWPHLEAIHDPVELDAELTRVRTEYNTVRLHAALGYVTPDDEHTGRGEEIRHARRDGLARARQDRIAWRRSRETSQP